MAPPGPAATRANTTTTPPIATRARGGQGSDHVTPPATVWATASVPRMTNGSPIVTMTEAPSQHPPATRERNATRPNRPRSAFCSKEPHLLQQGEVGPLLTELSESIPVLRAGG